MEEKRKEKKKLHNLFFPPTSAPRPPKPNILSRRKGGEGGKKEDHEEGITATVFAECKSLDSGCWREKGEGRRRKKRGGKRMGFSCASYHAMYRGRGLTCEVLRREEKKREEGSHP